MPSCEMKINVGYFNLSVVIHHTGPSELQVALTEGRSTACLQRATSNKMVKV